MKRTYTAIVHWQDGEVEDADEISVLGESAEDAKSAARKKWRTTIGLKWPHCRLVEIEVAEPTKRREWGL